MQLFFAGCGGSGLELVPVSGRITYAGGDWPAAGVLYFSPVKSPDSQAVRPATATFDTSGNFRASSFAAGDGLVPGKYSIRVECWEAKPSLEPHAPPAKSYVPAAYQTGTAPGLEVVVPAGANQPVHVTFDVPRPH